MRTWLSDLYKLYMMKYTMYYVYTHNNTQYHFLLHITGYINLNCTWSIATVTAFDVCLCMCWGKYTKYIVSQVLYARIPPKSFKLYMQCISWCMPTIMCFVFQWTYFSQLAVVSWCIHMHSAWTCCCFVLSFCLPLLLTFGALLLTFFLSFKSILKPPTAEAISCWGW